MCGKFGKLGFVEFCEFKVTDEEEIPLSVMKAILFLLAQRVSVEVLFFSFFFQYNIVTHEIMRNME